VSHEVEDRRTRQADPDPEEHVPSWLTVE
jgi:hypothetical protein